jgi:hypothetical protein
MHVFCGVFVCWRSVRFDIGKDRRQCPGDYSMPCYSDWSAHLRLWNVSGGSSLKINPKNMGESMVGARSKPRAVENRLTNKLSANLGLGLLLSRV